MKQDQRAQKENKPTKIQHTSESQKLAIKVLQNHSNSFPNSRVSPSSDQKNLLMRKTQFNNKFMEVTNKFSNTTMNYCCGTGDRAAAQGGIVHPTQEFKTTMNSPDVTQKLLKKEKTSSILESQNNHGTQISVSNLQTPKFQYMKGNTYGNINVVSQPQINMN